MKKILSRIVIIIPLFILLGYFIFNSQVDRSKNPKTPRVLGEKNPQIFISQEHYGYYSTGGVISIASTDEPAVFIGGYDINGNVDVSVYQVNENNLFDFLLYDKENKQIKPNPSTDSFQLVQTLQHSIISGYDKGTKVVLPLNESGIYYLKVSQQSVKNQVFIVRSKTGTVVKEGDNEYIFWAQDFVSRRSIKDASIAVYNLKDNQKELFSSSFNSEGIVKAPLTKEADIAVVRAGADKAIVPINLQYLNYSYDYDPFQSKTRVTKYFIFTDRPLYRPGDIVYFKAILRDDDDARYSVPSGLALVKIFDGWNDDSLIFQNNFPISDQGTVNGDYTLPVNSKTGYYRIEVSIEGSTTGSSSFNVEYFRKPDYSIDITTSSTELIAGDTSSFTISGNYFSGHTLSNQKVKYTVYSGNYYDYDYIQYKQTLTDDYRYGYWGGRIVTSGDATLNIEGKMDINLDTKTTDGTTQVYSIEATIDDGSGNPSFARKNILIYPGEYGIYRKESSYSTKVNTQYDLPLVLVARRNAPVSNISLTAKIHRTTWISYQEENKKYPSYKKEEENLPAVTTQTDQDGNTILTFTPTKEGSYDITVEGKDSRGNTIKKVFSTYVTNYNTPYYFNEQNNGLVITQDKKEYDPSDKASLTISSITKDRDVLLTFERSRVNRYQVVHLNGNNTTVDVSLLPTDVPNIFIMASSFSAYDLDGASTNIYVSTESKKLNVRLTPDRKTYGPGDTTSVTIETTDSLGFPYSAEVAIWAVDKALFELVDQKPANIFNEFWRERYNDTQQSHSLRGINIRSAEMGGGCFDGSTLILMADGTTKAIKDIQVGDLVASRKNEKDKNLTSAVVKNIHKMQVSGYFIINSQLKVTPNHRLFINGKWQEAAVIQKGDNLIDKNGNEVEVTSIEWQKGKFTVYNLELDKYHTYFAGGVWVHNQKGANRTVFKDTAYWNPRVITDTQGRAQISFKLPDNLTTWVVSAIGSTVDTKVGQTTAEVTVTKDVIVRPILPNIIREKDEIVLSALVQNFKDEEYTFDVDLEFDSGEVKSEATHSGILIKPKETKQLEWLVAPTKITDKAGFTFSAWVPQNTKISDTILSTLPIRSFGFFEPLVQTGVGEKTFSINLSSNADKEKSTITLSLSPSLVGTLPTAMKYLVDYPYGCVEQTTSRFVPAVIAKLNSSLFSNALENKNLDEIIQKGIGRLAQMQLPDGGWTWWYSGQSDPFVTAYVTQYLVLAKEAGITVDASILKRAEAFLSDKRSNDTNEDKIAKYYGLTLLNSTNKEIHGFTIDAVSPDLVALATIAWYKNGKTELSSQGVNQLKNLAKSQGDSLYWLEGDKKHFGTNDASTALAIQALILTGDKDSAQKGIQYLSKNRRFNYWSNSFATSQVIKAIVDVSKISNELTPNYSYTISLNGSTISDGVVNDAGQRIKDINIPIEKINTDNSTLSLTKTGDGQLYSTLIINQFYNDPLAKAVNHGLEVRREYLNDKGDLYTSLAVGDTVTVNITVSGLENEANYAVIADELPSGLIPINTQFTNQQYDQNSSNNWYDVSDREVTENGMVLSLYRISSGTRSYTYKARVVNQGVFIVPPVFATLMYSPEVYGRSEVQTIKVGKIPEVIPKKTPTPKAEYKGERFTIGNGIQIIVLIIILSTIVFIAKRRGWLRRNPPDNVV